MPFGSSAMTWMSSSFPLVSLHLGARQTGEMLHDGGLTRSPWEVDSGTQLDPRVIRESHNVHAHEHDPEEEFWSVFDGRW